MKKYISFFLISFIPMLAFCKNVKTISLSYNKNDFNIVIKGGKAIITSSIHTLTLNSNTKEPALPYIGVNVVVEQDEQYSSFSYISSEFLFADDIDIPPCPEHLPVSSPANNINIDYKYANSVFPDASVIYTGTNLMDGYRILSFVVCPFRYDVVSHQLFLKTSIKLTIILETPIGNRNNVRNGNIGLNMKRGVTELVINKDEINELHRSIASTSSNNYQYLIVTSNSLKPAFQLLADWKTRKGVKAKVLTIEEINNTYSGSTQQLRIKSALLDYYNGNHNGLKYTLLGGDVSIVPSQQCYIRYQYNNEIHESQTPTDLYYACLDNMNWDTNNNGMYGEVSDNIDIIPEIIVSRLPASTVQEAETMINKIISYERNPDIQNWENKILMSGASVDSVLHYENGSVFSDVEYRGDSIYNGYILPYWTGLRVRFYDTNTDFPQGGAYELNGDNLQTELQKGYNFIYMDTHGRYECWELEKDSSNNPLYYGYTKANTLHNSGNSIIITSACYTNGFDQTTCLSKSFMRNPNGGILAYLGSSRSAWYAKNINYLGASNEINSTSLKKLFMSETHCLAEAHQQAKVQYVLTNPTYNHVYRWLHFSLNPLCDPEMPVYMSMPNLFSDVNIHLSNDTLYVSTGLSDCKITAMSISDNGQSLYEVHEDVSNAIISNFSIGDGICITKPGYIPYIADFSDIVYIQNESFERQKTIWANNVCIGSDVTTSKPNGPVAVENGATTIYGKNVTIKNDFEVKTGASFEIRR